MLKLVKGNWNRQAKIYCCKTIVYSEKGDPRPDRKVARLKLSCVVDLKSKD